MRRKEKVAQRLPTKCQNQTALVLSHVHTLASCFLAVANKKLF